MEKYEKKIRNLRLFASKDLIPIVGSENVAKMLMRRYKRAQLIGNVRDDLFAFVDPETKKHTINKYELGSHVTSDSYLAYHTALEYHGFTTQRLADAYIISTTRFIEFMANGIYYWDVGRAINLGVYSPDLESLIWVTDLERTVVDCFNRPNCGGGLEEILRCLCLINYLDEKKLVLYLEAYNKPVLYRKLGCFLYFFRKTVHVSEDFFTYCKTKIGDGAYIQSTLAVPRIYITEWQVYISKVLHTYLLFDNSERIRLIGVVSHILPSE